jgi:4-amino-4-deoxy-L-arabinose transferase-like glycosyltransferase
MKFLKKNLLLLLLSLIFALSLFLRLYQLDSFPVGFHQDEAALGYNAYSLLLTGKDENGQSFPLYVNKFGDNNPSGYHHLAILPVAVFGLNEFATRLPAAIAGSLLVLAIFYLAYAISRNKFISLFAAFFSAIAPWSIVLSRTSAETIVALFFAILGFALLIQFLRDKNILFLSGSVLLWIASFLTYPAPRVYVPLLVLATGIFLFRYIREKKLVVPSFLSFTIIIAVLLFLILGVSGGTGRFSQVSIFTHPETRLILEEQFREDGMEQIPPTIARIFHNKIINHSYTFLLNYSSYFSLEYLFLKGGQPLLLNVPHMGLLYIVQLPFILIGIYSVIRSKNYFSKLLLVWLLLAPVTAAITFDDSPNVRRALIMFPFMEIIAGYGMYFTFKKITKDRSKKIFASLFALFLLYNFVFFLHQYFVHTKVHKPWFRDVGVKEMVAEIRDSYGDYDKVIVTKNTGGIYPNILFYMQYDPFSYQKEGSLKDQEYKGFGKFVFVPQDCPSVNRDPNFPEFNSAIFVDKGVCPLVEGQNYKIIYRGDKTPVYRVVYED